jgi:hypothetical protein
MAFVQIVEFHTSDLASGTAVYEEWERATEGKRTTRRRLLLQDRNDPTRYFNLVFFDSYESAMENSALAETQQFSAQMMASAEAPATFYDLNVLDDREG